MPATVISYWGKGGVGKTTLAAATGVMLAEEGARVLLVSSDPTPTLSKLLEDAEPGLLEVVEITEERVVELWKQRFGEEVYRVASSFLPVGREFIDYVAGAPGIADQYMLYYIYETWRRGRYDYIVWDTQAAGGSVRLLRLEREVYSHLGEAIRLYLRVRGLLDRLRRGDADPLSLLESWRRLAEDILSFLASGSHRLYLVATADPLSLHVSRRLVQELASFKIRVGRVILNMLVDPGVCPGCGFWADIAEEQQRLRKLFEEEFSRSPGLCLVPRLPRSPSSIGELRMLIDALRGCGLP